MDIKYTIELIGSAFELVGVIVLVIGSILAFLRYVVDLIRLRDGPLAFRHLRLYLGRAIVLGLEVLALIVLVRTFLSWSLEVEINGEWPWQRSRLHKGEPANEDEL